MSVSGLGPVPPPNEPGGGNPLSQALESYAELLDPSHAQNLDQNLRKIAQTTIELNHLAQSVMDAASPKLRSIGIDLEHLLQSPLSVTTMNQEVSILNASEHYLENPSTAELGPLIQELRHNHEALVVMRNELILLSDAVKNPSAAGS